MKLAFATLIATPFLFAACSTNVAPLDGPGAPAASEAPARAAGDAKAEGLVVNPIPINPVILCEISGGFTVPETQWSCTTYEDGVLLCSPKTVDECESKVPFPQMPTWGGSVLPQLQLVTVAFQGDEQYLNIGSTTTTPTATLADEFGDFIVGSQWLQTVTASYVPGPFSAKHLAKVTLPAYTGGSFDLTTFIQQGIAQGTLPNPGGAGVLYQVYVPAAGCGTQPSYHEAVQLPGGEVVLASQICGSYTFAPGNYAPSHEIIETITDPYYSIGQTGYTFVGGTSPWALEGEVADACTGVTSPTEAGWGVASVWSNTAAAAGGSPCVPTPASYANVSPSGPFPYTSSQYSTSSWNTGPMVVPVGSSVTIALSGWNSPATTTPWDVSAQVLTATSQFTPTLSLSGGTAGPSGSVQISDGATVMLTIGVPAGTPTGRIATLLVVSDGQGGTWPLEVVAK